MTIYKNIKSSIIIEIKGSQYIFEKGKFYTIESLQFLRSKSFFFNKVLMFTYNKNLFLGTPYLKNIKIKIKIIDQLKKPKIITYKMKPKKGYSKKSGFSKTQTRILITGIFIKNS